MGGPNELVNQDSGVWWFGGALGAYGVEGLALRALGV